MYIMLKAFREWAVATAAAKEPNSQYRHALVELITALEKVMTFH